MGEVPDLIEKSKHALVLAQKLHEDGFSPDVASRAYYCMFYAAQALLKLHGIKAVKHSGVEAQLGYHFSRTGKIAPKYHKMLKRARILREDADYAVGIPISQSQAEQLISECEEFLKEMVRLIGIGI